MSHIVTMETQVKDVESLARACARLGLEAPQDGEWRLFSGTTKGVAVKLPGWRYPAVFNLESGKVKFDNYNGAWGKQSEMDSLMQRYSAEVVRKAARKAGHSFLREVAMADGSIKVVVGAR